MLLDDASRHLDTDPTFCPFPRKSNAAGGGPGRFDNFDAPYPIVGLSPVEFDVSASHGDGLSYLIEFGDGETSTAAKATHLVTPGHRVARVTVSDRYGRSDSDVVSYQSVGLGSLYDVWFDAMGRATG